MINNLLAWIKTNLPIVNHRDYKPLKVLEQVTIVKLDNVPEWCP
jgi:hypothetical protein